MVAFLASLVWPKVAPKARLRTAVVRITVAADGSVQDVKLIRGSRVASWDKEILDKAQRARFTEAMACGGLVIDLSIWPDRF